MKPKGTRHNGDSTTDSSSVLSPSDKLASVAIEFIVGAFGRARAILGEWPHREIVGTAVDTLRDFGAVLHHESGTPCGELEVFYFRIRGRRMRLCIEDYGSVTLWGPKQLVSDISKQVAERLSRKADRVA